MTQNAIGIDSNTTALYEGSVSLYGHAVWPAPFISLADYIGPRNSEETQAAAPNLHSARMVFREDSFDPVARIRRGRLYTRHPITPESWHVQQHPAYASRSYSSAGAHGGPDYRGYTQANLVTFLSWVAPSHLWRNLRDAVLVMGTGERSSSHAVLDIERLANGEELITVRTRASLSGLPQLVDAAIPPAYVALVLEQYEKAASAAYRDDAESVVDRCREAATAALIAERMVHLAPGTGSPAKDLGELANFFSGPQSGDKGGRAVLSNAARIMPACTPVAKRLSGFNTGRRD